MFLTKLPVVNDVATPEINTLSLIVLAAKYLKEDVEKRFLKKVEMEKGRKVSNTAVILVNH